MKNKDEKQKLFKGFKSEFSETQIIIFLKELIQYRKKENQIEFKQSNHNFENKQIDGLRFENEILLASEKYLKQLIKINEKLNLDYPIEILEEQKQLLFSEMEFAKDLELLEAKKRYYQTSNALLILKEK